jgi:hypothetical protein
LGVPRVSFFDAPDPEIEKATPVAIEGLGKLAAEVRDLTFRSSTGPAGVITLLKHSHNGCTYLYFFVMPPSINYYLRRNSSVVV